MHWIEYERLLAIYNANLTQNPFNRIKYSIESRKKNHKRKSKMNAMKQIVEKKKYEYKKNNCYKQ